MIDIDLWDLVKLLEGVKLIDCKWIFKTKRDSKGIIERHKTSLMVKRFTQNKGIDYKDTLSSVYSKDSFKTIMILIVHFDLELHHTDIKTTFRNDNFEETIYIMQP